MISNKEHNCIIKIGVVCMYPFPQGMAPTTRIIAYCKGLQMNGVETEIFSMQIGGKIHSKNGCVEGIPYYNTRKRIASRKLTKLIVDIPISVVATLFQLIKSNKKKKFDYLLLSFDSLFFTYLFYPLLKFHGFKISFIGDEYPGSIREKLNNQLTRREILLYKIIHKLLDNRILMTNKLRDFYDSIIGRKPTYILSTIIDIDRFEGVVRQRVDTPYLCYMGNLMLAKDNVDNIILAFDYIKDLFPKLELHLYGTPNTNDLRLLNDLITSKKLDNRVLFKGRVSYEQVPQILANALILVTSQPATKRAEGGFPTKMGEYMMSGVPALLTEVGEINNYIQDGINAYMVKPCRPLEYSEKIAYILTHTDEAAQVAERGKKYILENFSAQISTKGLINFLQDNY